MKSHTSINNNNNIKTNAKTNVSISNTYRIFAGGVPCKISQSELLSFFSQHCNSLQTIELPLQRNKKKKETINRNKGFAIVHLTNEEETNSLLSKNFLLLDNRRLILRPYLNGKLLNTARADKESRTVFISGFVLSLSLSDISEQLSKKFGPVEDIFRLFNPITKKKKACAYCFFREEGSAEAAIAQGELNVRGDIYIQFQKYDKKRKPIFKQKLREKIFERVNDEKEMGNHSLRPTIHAYHQQRTHLKDHPHQYNIRLNRSRAFGGRPIIDRIFRRR